MGVEGRGNGQITRALVAGILVAAAAVTLRAEILEQIIVKVNGEIVTKTDFEQRQVSALRARNMQTQGAAPDQLKQAVAEVTPSLIVDAVDELLLLQRGKDLKYSLSDEQFKQIVDQHPQGEQTRGRAGVPGRLEV